MMAFYGYIMTNKRDGVLHAGMTDDVNRRARMHRERVLRGFADRYNREMPVWYEAHDSRESAFVRERRIKDSNRACKIRRIEEVNPDRRDPASERI